MHNEQKPLITESSPSPYFQRRVGLANDNMRLTANSEIMCYFPVDLPLSFSFSLCLRNVVDEGDRFLTKSTWCDCTAGSVCGGGWPGLPREIKSLIGAVLIRNGHWCVPGKNKSYAAPSADHCFEELRGCLFVLFPEKTGQECESGNCRRSYVLKQ